MTGIPVEGTIDVVLAVANGHFAQVTVKNRRLLSATGALSGRRPAETVAMVTRLFSICRMAQGIAGAQAVEAAAGHELSLPQQAARRFLVQAETVLEHAGRALIDWPQQLGETPVLAAAKTLRAALADLIVTFTRTAIGCVPAAGVSRHGSIG